LAASNVLWPVDALWERRHIDFNDAVRRGDTRLAVPSGWYLSPQETVLHRSFFNTHILYLTATGFHLFPPTAPDAETS
jgi:hypothetical protein